MIVSVADIDIATSDIIDNICGRTHDKGLACIHYQGEFQRDYDDNRLHGGTFWPVTAADALQDVRCGDVIAVLETAAGIGGWTRDTSFTSMTERVVTTRAKLR